jgi:hypothetical protein
MARTAKEVFEDHLEKRRAGKVEEDIAANFSPDVIILGRNGIQKGHEGVRYSAGELQRHLGDAEFSYVNQLVEGDYAFLEWQGVSDKRQVCDGADSFVIRDGKIVMQTVHYRAVDNDEDS